MFVFKYSVILFENVYAALNRVSASLMSWKKHTQEALVLCNTTRLGSSLSYITDMKKKIHLDTLTQSAAKYEHFEVIQSNHF